MLLCRIEVAQRCRCTTTVAQGGHQQGGVAKFASQIGGIRMQGQGFFKQLVFPVGEAEVVFDLRLKEFRLGLVEVAVLDGQQCLTERLSGCLRLFGGTLFNALLKERLSFFEPARLVMAGR